MDELDVFWLVWSPSGARPPSHRHTSYESAKTEAERLASTAPGSVFYVLEAMGFARKVEVAWTDLAPGGAYDEAGADEVSLNEQRFAGARGMGL